MLVRNLLHDIDSAPFDGRPSECNNIAKSGRNKMERGRTNSRQEFGIGAVNIHCQFGIRVKDENIIGNFGWRNLQEIGGYSFFECQRVPNTGKIHCNVERAVYCPWKSRKRPFHNHHRKFVLSSERLAVAPIYSKVLLKTVEIRNIASDSACADLFDGFHISRCVIEIDRSRHPRISPLPKFPVPQNIVLPEWLNDNKERKCETHSNQLRHIQVSECALRFFQELTFPQFLSIYGDFFYNLWDRTKEELGRKVKIVYEFLNPPRLRCDVVFLDSPNNCKSVPTKKGILPRKVLLKDRDQKIVGCSIPVAWIQ